MNPVCASHPCPNINIRARLHTRPESPETHQRLTYADQEEDKRPSICPELASLRSHLTTLEGGFFQRRGDEEIHLLTDSAILDFCSSPSSVTWSAPTFTRGGITGGWRWDSTLCPIIWVVCPNLWSVLLPGESKGSTLIFGLRLIPRFIRRAHIYRALYDQVE